MLGIPNPDPDPDPDAIPNPNRTLTHTHRYIVRHWHKLATARIASLNAVQLDFEKRVRRRVLRHLYHRSVGRLCNAADEVYSCGP